MKIEFNKNLLPIATTKRPVKNTASHAVNNLHTDRTLINTLDCIANLNRANISFKGYNGDWNPARKLFWVITGRGPDSIYRDDDTDRTAWRVNTQSIGQKAWSTLHPSVLLNRNLEQAIQSICTLNNTYEILNDIGTPNYGDTWGRNANYIEINPRLIAKAEGDRLSEGILNAIKLLPAIPPSTKNIANCVILSQVYPTKGSYTDGHTYDSGLYTTEIQNGISKNLISYNLEREGHWVTPDEQVKAFNDLAHFRGLKTGVRMPIASDQLSIKGRQLNWWNRDDEEAFINACCWLIDLGFDCIYFDSAKHVGNYDMGNCHAGELPDWGKMQYITSQIRARTRNDVSIVGEKATSDPRFEQLGYTAGTDWGRPGEDGSVWHEYNNQKWNSKYAAGPDVSNDNDEGAMSYDERLNRIKRALHEWDDPWKKLPVFMQMHDLLPLSEYGPNTHEAMEHGINKTAYGDVASHYNNIFSSSDAAHWHTIHAYQEFEKLLQRNG